MIRSALAWVRNALRKIASDLARPIVEEARQTAFLDHQFQRARQGNNLLGQPVRFFSQNDEDHILLEILRRIGKDDRGGVFLELGVGDGLENNTIVLLASGWTGGWVGGEELAFDWQHSRLSYERAWIKLDNVLSLANASLSRCGKQLSDVDVAVIDLDGNDYHFAVALLDAGLTPSVFIVEYNAKFMPPLKFIMDYNADHTWNYDDCFGASLSSWDELLVSRGYRLVACNLNGANAFFVKADYGDRFSDIPSDPSAVFVPGIHRLLPQSGHPTSARLLRQLIRP